MSDTDEITVYSDYVCPFCYLGRKSLAAYHSDREERLDIDWRPFDLRAGKRGPDGEIDQNADDGKKTRRTSRRRRRTSSASSRSTAPTR